MAKKQPNKAAATVTVMPAKPQAADPADSVTTVYGDVVPAAELGHIPPKLRVLAVRVDSLQPDPNNARTHGERSDDAITSSLSQFGQQKPIVIDSGRVVRAGNGTRAAAKKLGWIWIAAVESNLSGDRLTAYAIADNRTADLSEWDPEALRDTLDSLDLADLDITLAGLGFADGELDALAMGDADGAHGFAPKKPAPAKGTKAAGAGTGEAVDQFKIVVACRDEAHQVELLERFEADGIEARALVA